MWVHRRGLDIEIEESVQFDQKKRVIFDIVDAPKGNMAIRVRNHRNNCSVVKPDQNEEHHRILGDSPTEPSVVCCEPEVCVHGWRSPQANNLEEKSQGSNDQDLVLTEEGSQSEIDKGVLSREDEGVEDAGEEKRVQEEKEEDLAESEDSPNQ